jgi:hypothetical protein
VSGVRGEWTGGGGKLTHTRANTVYNAENTMDPSSSVGDYTLMAKSKSADGVSDRAHIHTRCRALPSHLIEPFVNIHLAGIDY